MLIRNVITCLPLVVLLVTWEWLTAGSARLRFLFASPSMIANAAQEELFGAAIWIDVAYTSVTALAGLTIGWTTGSVLGLSLWSLPSVARIAKPYLLAISAVPVFALAPMLIIWFGIGLGPKVVMAAFPVFLACSTAAFWSARAAESRHSEWMSGLGLTRRQRMVSVIVPEALGDLFEQLRQCVGAALVGTFIGEFVVSQAGLGRFILRAGGLYDMPRVFLGLVLMIGVSAVFIGWATIAAHLGTRGLLAREWRTR